MQVTHCIHMIDITLLQEVSVLISVFLVLIEDFMITTFIVFSDPLITLTAQVPCLTGLITSYHQVITISLKPGSIWWAQCCTTSG